MKAEVGYLDSENVIDVMLTPETGMERGMLLKLVGSATRLPAAARHEDGRIHIQVGFAGDGLPEPGPSGGAAREAPAAPTPPDKASEEAHLRDEGWKGIREF